MWGGNTMTIKNKDFAKLLKKNGWKEIRINGSHHIFQKDDKIVTVPIHGKDLKIGLLTQLLKQTGINL